ncbi:imidazoleglycerol-phosphate dehydratase HisB [Candidatus Marinamargulisbacteria bacterium SCGC AG-343-D04]|nr:imidazoleglycerol-phosphate dehydratase HisB [Candidatus Marinamargulisbacteria bacterium SCGC AG-343-D04]
MGNKKREAFIERQTNETDIFLEFSIDGSGEAKLKTGIGFLDHMLDLFTKHGCFDLTCKVKGDLHVDFHHSVEDVGICLGQAFHKAMGDFKGITRFANVVVPMDESLCSCAIDISNRPYLGFKHSFNNEKVGNFDTELVEEFFNAFVNNARINCHIAIQEGKNTHHKIEACFKAFAVCLDKATQLDPRKTDIPSTKGLL